MQKKSKKIKPVNIQTTPCKTLFLISEINFERLVVSLHHSGKFVSSWAAKHTHTHTHTHTHLRFVLRQKTLSQVPKKTKKKQKKK